MQLLAYAAPGTIASDAGAPLGDDHTRIGIST
jgi:hypothetical protein